MRVTLNPTPLTLAAGALLHISDGRGHSLRVLVGRIWVTEEGRVEDVFAEAGDTVTFEKPGRAVVTAEGRRRATVVFDAAASLVVAASHESS